MRGYAFFGPQVYYHASAGIRGWFALAERLRSRGYDVIHTHADPGDRIVVYPDVVSGNPLGSERVVRWMLYYPDGHGVPTDVGVDELVFAWVDPFWPGAPILKVEIFEHELFNDVGVGERTHDSYYRGKGHEDEFPCPDGAKRITRVWPRTRPEVAAMLRSTRTLYTADRNTSLSTEALMCGCRVVNPDGELTVPDCPSDAEYAAMLDRFITLTQERWPSDVAATM